MESAISVTIDGVIFMRFSDHFLESGATRMNSDTKAFQIGTEAN
jgi:hypothetical protein